MRHLELIAGLLLIHSLALGQVVVRGQRANIVVNPNTTVTVSVTFASSPSSVSIKHADLWANKTCVLNFEADDGSPKFRYVYAMWHGGKAPDSVNYTGFTYTDGCGNAVRPTAALAINARGGFLNNELGISANKASNMIYSEMADMVKNDWALENHSYYHDPTTRYSYKYDAGRNVRELHQLIYDKLKVYGVEYVMRTLVAPSSWTNFFRVADSLGYLCASSQGVRDNYPLYPASGQTYFGTETLPAGFVTFGRAFDDVWSASTVAGWKTTFDGLISGSTATHHLMWRLGTHGPQNPAGFLEFTNYLAANHQDKVWFCTMHQLMEYFEVKRQVKKTQTLVGNTLTLQLNLANVSARNRYRDMSLLINSGGVTITNVQVTNAGGYSFNTATGLINIFKKKDSGFTPF